MRVGGGSGGVFRGRRGACQRGVVDKGWGEEVVWVKEGGSGVGGRESWCVRNGKSGMGEGGVVRDVAVLREEKCV